MQRRESREPVILEQKENMRLFGVFHRPMEEKKSPAVLICHGFGGTKVGRYRLYVRLAEALAEQGIATLRLDFRGCGDSEGDFCDVTLKQQLADAAAGLAFLRKNPYVDSERLGLLGRSLGGLVAVLTACEARDIKSLALWAAVFHGNPWLEQWEEAKRFAQTQGKDLEVLPFQGQLANRELFEQFFAVDMDQELTHLQDLPLLCIHSRCDEVVDAEHCLRFQRSRQKASGLTRFVHLQKSNHDFSDPKEQEKTIQETVHWYTNTLREKHARV